MPPTENGCPQLKKRTRLKTDALGLKKKDLMEAAQRSFVCKLDAYGNWEALGRPFVLCQISIPCGLGSLVLVKPRHQGKCHQISGSPQQTNRMYI